MVITWTEFKIKWRLHRWKIQVVTYVLNKNTNFKCSYSFVFKYIKRAKTILYRFCVTIVLIKLFTLVLEHITKHQNKKTIKLKY